MVRDQIPNFLRLYLNPYVAQTCLSLAGYVKTTWKARDASEPDYQSFLANGFDEGLSGAIKLARYSASIEGKPSTGLIFDGADRLGSYASAWIIGGRKVEFLPGLTVVGKNTRELNPTEVYDGPFGFVVLVGDKEALLDQFAEQIRQVISRDAPLIIACMDRQNLAMIRGGSTSVLSESIPDIVIFDESFVDYAVPFSAFASRKALYDHWNRPGKTTFHSTTYQPNTIASLHFMKCLQALDPDFYAAIAQDLEQVQADIQVRRNTFRRLYNPSLYRMIRASGFDTADVRAAGNFAVVDGKQVFDAVGGVACSIRGHNPGAYLDELAGQEALPDCQAELGERLRELTHLECALPAVSGATAVENALKIALVARFPRRHILALKAGFGGKTLLALTGTANPSYKQHIAPLYLDVLYVDPFAPDALEQIESACKQHPIAVVQIELVQAVGGVRQVPERVIRHLQARRQEFGYLLLVDEVQTGIYRTGSFTMSGAMSLSPDILLLGKGTSDMMFPFALTLHSAAVRKDLERTGSSLPEQIQRRYGYEFGFRTVLNVLYYAEETAISRLVTESGVLFTQLLSEGLASCKAVREIRVFGLLIGIELETTRWPQRWLGKRLFWLYLFSMLYHPRYPVLVGFCQYEPNVLKITPALTIAPEEIRKVCATITEVLSLPFHRLLANIAGGFMKLPKPWRKQYEHHNDSANEPVAR